MKKIMFFWAAATVALASCSSEDVIELNNGNAIDFRVATSRGQETTGANIGQFIVTAIDGSNNYFSQELFTKEAASNRYVSSSEYFWPGTRELAFYAYSYYTGTNGDKLNAIEDSKLGAVTINATDQKIEGFVPAAKVENQIDFVSAYTKASSLDEVKGVELNFNHNLIQTEVKAFTKNTNYSFEIAGIKFGNIISKGDFVFKGTADETKGQWTLAGDEKADYTVEYATAITLDPEAAEATDLSDLATVGHMMVLPQQLDGCDMENDKANITKKSYLAVKLKITRTDANAALVFPAPASGEEYGWAYIPVSTEWTMGNRYVYTLDFSRGAGYDENGDPILGEPIFFTAEVKNWQDNNISEDMHVDNK